ncbi:hypothetical protein [Thermaurantimonas aggregans]|nr:hypothetical protein [Thermaurantimonas aggregans]MCX8149391.1 hypothetical protein [Thermaurantimonas aggregans]
MRNILLTSIVAALGLLACNKDNLKTTLSQPDITAQITEPIKADFLPNKWYPDPGECRKEKGDCFDEVEVTALSNSVRSTLGELPSMSIDEVANVFASGLLAEIPGFDLPEFSEIYSYISAEGALVTSEQHGNKEYYRFFAPSGAELFVLQLLNE